MNLKRFNDGIARGEAALAMGMLLVMLVVAFAQAMLRNLTNFNVGWANVALRWIDWADFIISKGTLWLAFLGASLAVHGDKHISIDLVPRMASPRARVLMRGIASVIGSVICFFLARAFWTAVIVNGDELSGELAVLVPEGTVHVCDATAAQLGDAHRPAVFCAARAFFRLLGVTIETPGPMFEAIAPVSFLFMTLRFFGQGVYELRRFARGEVDDDPGAHGITGDMQGVHASGDARASDPKKDR